jgi:hypothetical protein
VENVKELPFTEAEILGLRKNLSNDPHIFHSLYGTLFLGNTNFAGITKKIGE